MILKTSDFSFKGERKYINFASLLETFRSTVTTNHRSSYKKLLIKNFKIHRYITENSSIKIFNDPDLKKSNYKNNILVEMNCLIDEKPYFVGLYNENHSPIKKKIEFPDKELVGTIRLKNPFSGSCDFIKFKNHHEFFQAFTTANKQLHLLSLPKSDQHRELKSAFLGELSIPSKFFDNEAHLTIKNLDIKENPTHHFTFNQLTLDIKGQKFAFQLCYSIKKHYAPAY